MKITLYGWDSIDTESCTKIQKQTFNFCVDVFDYDFDEKGKLNKAFPDYPWTGSEEPDWYRTFGEAKAGLIRTLNKKVAELRIQLMQVRKFKYKDVEGPAQKGDE